MIRLTVEKCCDVEHYKVVDRLLKSLKDIEIIRKEDYSEIIEYLLEVKDDMLSILQMLDTYKVFHVSDTEYEDEKELSGQEIKIQGMLASAFLKFIESKGLND